MDNESILGTLSYQTFLAQWKRILPEYVNYPPPKGGELRVFASTEPLVLPQKTGDA